MEKLLITYFEILCNATHFISKTLEQFQKDCSAFDPTCYNVFGNPFPKLGTC